MLRDQRERRARLLAGFVRETDEKKRLLRTQMRTASIGHALKLTFSADHTLAALEVLNFEDEAPPLPAHVGQPHVPALFVAAALDEQ